MNLTLLNRALDNAGHGPMSDEQRRAMFARLRSGGAPSRPKTTYTDRYGFAYSPSGYRVSREGDNKRSHAPVDGGPEAMAASGGGPSSMVLHPLGDVLGEIGAGTAQLTAEATGANETAVSLLAEAVRVAFAPRSALGRTGAKTDAVLGLIGDAAESKPLSKKLLGRLALNTDDELRTILADAQQRRDKETVRAVTDLLTGEVPRPKVSETRKLLGLPKGFTFEGHAGPWIRQGLDKPTIAQARKAITDWAKDRKLYLQQKLQAKGGSTPATFANAGRGPMNEAQRRAMWAKRQNPAASAGPVRGIDQMPGRQPPARVPVLPGTPVKGIDQLLDGTPRTGRKPPAEDALRLRLIQDQLRRAIDSGQIPRPYIPIQDVPVKPARPIEPRVTPSGELIQPQGQPSPRPSYATGDIRFPGQPSPRPARDAGAERQLLPIDLPALRVPPGGTRRWFDAPGASDPHLEAIIRSVDDLLARRGGAR